MYYYRKCHHIHKLLEEEMREKEEEVTVMVNGVAKPFSEVTNEDLDAMSKEEYEAYQGVADEEEED